LEISYGGTAVAESQASGNATVVTGALATNNGTAIAQQSATSGTHLKAVRANGTDVTVTKKHSNNGQATQPPTPKDEHNATRPDWDAASACPVTATNVNKTEKDDEGRLWGWNPANNASCAFKAPVYDLYDYAPVCPDSVPRESAVLDESGRPWGWFANVSCTFQVRVRVGGHDGLQELWAVCSHNPEPCTLTPSKIYCGCMYRNALLYRYVLLHAQHSVPPAATAHTMSVLPPRVHVLHRCRQLLRLPLSSAGCALKQQQTPRHCEARTSLP
jgi:hypothetical protein